VLSDLPSSILIVDDDPTITSILTEAVKILYPGTLVSRAFTADDALPLLENKHYDLLITDNVMPGMAGIDMAEIVKEKYPQTRVVLVSAFRNTALMRRLDEMGGIGFLPKPFGLNDLAELLEPDYLG
jgi:YesN/AraC family two-component response regulator